MKRVLAMAVMAVIVAGCTTPAKPSEPLTPTGGEGEGGDAGSGAGNNTTIVYKPPVARMQVYDADGALAFESNFVADNATAPNHVTGGKPLTFLGAPSEAVEKDARVEAWQWSFGDGGSASGRSVTHAYTDLGGMFDVRLTVADTHGLTDELVVKLAVEPTRTFHQAVSVEGTVQGPGNLGTLQMDGIDIASDPLAVAAQVQGFDVVVVSATFTLTPKEPTSDFDLYLLDPEGNVTAQSATGPAPGGSETITLTGADLKAGSYTFQVVLFLGVNAGYAIDGEVVYKVVNHALMGEGEHHH
jgi:hypothetical protein